MPNRMIYALYHDDKYEKLWMRLAPVDGGASHSGLSQKKNEIIELWQLFDRMQPHVILEMGVAQGGTFAGWCQLAPDDALLIGIDRDVNDCWPRYGDQVHPDIADHCLPMTESGGGMHALKRKGSNQRIVPINGWSYEPKVMGTLLGVLDGKKIDFLFHDASHMCEDTAKDFKAYWPLIASGGVMAFHDIAHYSVGCDKWKWWREIRDDCPDCVASYSYQLQDKVDLGMGIGILFKA